MSDGPNSDPAGKTGTERLDDDDTHGQGGSGGPDE
jgi:hypothetical protein